MLLKLRQWKILLLKKWLKTWIFESFAGSKVICVENKYIPCLCTHTFCLLLATLTALGDKVRYFEGKWNLVKAFWIFTTTLESVRSAYKHFFSRIFYKKTSKIAMFSYVWEDVWEHNNFACFFMKNTWKELFVSTTYGL